MGIVFLPFSLHVVLQAGVPECQPDALSRIYDPEPVAKEPELILPLNCVVGAVTWQIEEKLKQANGETLPPRGCPEHCMFVPVELRPHIIHWAHTLLLTCHPGVQRTMFAISQQFWWPSMESGVREYIEACSVCARNKPSSGSRIGLLQPLSIPSRPWLDISMDFVTGLLVSKGNTTVLTVMDCFSKMTHFIALPKQPSAKETAQIMMQNIVRIHGFPQDIVSDRGPQFISWFWSICYMN